MDPLTSYKCEIETTRSKIKRLWNSWPWAFEVVALILSALQFIGMISILAYFNGRPAETSSSITPNTIVSILSTGSKASLLSATAGCISQSNWVLFADQPRRLFDFEIIADASRGPLGSIRLLLSQKFQGGLLVRLGAIITLLTIALDPFAQQLVKLQNIQTTRPGGRIFQASRYSLGKSMSEARSFGVGENGRMESDVPLIVDADFAMKAAGMFGLTSESENIIQQTALDCPGEACEFSKVASLAVCSKCNDITSLLKRTMHEGEVLYYKILTSKYTLNSSEGSWGFENCTRHSLPNGLYLDNTDGDTSQCLVYMTTSGTANSTKTLTMADINTLIWSQSIIKAVNDTSATSFSPWPNYDVYASECALYYCAREYNFTFYNTTKKEVSSTEITSVKRHPASWQLTNFKISDGVSPDIADSLAYHPYDSFLSHTDLQLYIDAENGLPRSWNISERAVEGISYFCQTLFSECNSNFQNCSDVPDEWMVPTGYYWSPFNDSFSQKAYQPTTSKILWETQDINTTFANVARSMSNALRAGDDNKHSQEGIVIQSVTTYRIEWEWIALHCTLALAMLLFFILTLSSRGPSGERVPVWKTSSLAILSRGHTISDILGDSQTSEQLERRAKLAQVSLLQVGPSDAMPIIHDEESYSSAEGSPTTIYNLSTTNKS